MDTVSDIDVPDLAVRPVFHRGNAAEVDAIGVRNPKHGIVVDMGVDRTVIAEDPTVVIRTGNIVDVIVPDFHGSILRIDIDGAGIHQEIHRRFFPIAVRLVDLIAFYDT